jgi:hypothetical protein
MGYSEARGKLILEKILKPKISCQTPLCNLAMRYMQITESHLQNYCTYFEHHLSGKMILSLIQDSSPMKYKKTPIPRHLQVTPTEYTQRRVGGTRPPPFTKSSIKLWCIRSIREGRYTPPVRQLLQSATPPH